MVTKMNLKLYKDNLLEQEHKDINCMYQNNNVSFLLNDCKMILNKHIFLRENNDFKFNINLNTKTCTILLKEQGKEFDIPIEQVSFSQQDKNMILAYKTASDDKSTKIVIELSD